MTTSPPDAWEVTTDGNGAWGSGVELSTAVYNSADASVLLKHTHQTGAWIAISTPAAKYAAVSPGDLLLHDAWVQSDDNRGAGWNHPYMGIRFYDAAKAFVSNTDTWNSTVTAPSVWEHKAGFVVVPAGCYWIGQYLAKTLGAVEDTNVWWDGGYVTPVTSTFFVKLSADLSVANGDTVIFDDKTDLDGPCYDYAGAYNATTGVYTAPFGGLYSFTATLMTGGLSAGQYLGLYFDRNGGVGAGGASAYGAVSRVHANSDLVSINSTYGPVPLAAGETIEVVVTHNHGSNINLDGISTYAQSWFAGGQIR